MKKRNYTEEQIAFALQQTELVRRYLKYAERSGNRNGYFTAGRASNGGRLSSDMNRLRQLEEENAMLKKPVADLSLDKLMLQDVLTKKF